MRPRDAVRGCAALACLWHAAAAAQLDAAAAARVRAVLDAAPAVAAALPAHPQSAALLARAAAAAGAPYRDIAAAFPGDAIGLCAFDAALASQPSPADAVALCRAFVDAQPDTRIAARALDRAIALDPALAAPWAAAHPGTRAARLGAQRLAAMAARAGNAPGTARGLLDALPPEADAAAMAANFERLMTTWQHCGQWLDAALCSGHAMGAAPPPGLRQRLAARAAAAQAMPDALRAALWNPRDAARPALEAAALEAAAPAPHAIEALLALAWRDFAAGDRGACAAQLEQALARLDAAQAPPGVRADLGVAAFLLGEGAGAPPPAAGAATGADAALAQILSAGGFAGARDRWLARAREALPALPAGEQAYFALLIARRQADAYNVAQAIAALDAAAALPGLEPAMRAPVEAYRDRLRAQERGQGAPAP